MRWRGGEKLFSSYCKDVAINICHEHDLSTDAQIGSDGCRKNGVGSYSENCSTLSEAARGDVRAALRRHAPIVNTWA
jgi:hypothetical protein